MGKLTIEQAKKFMEAAKNAETNSIDDKFYPESKITTADKIDTGEPRPLPDKKTKKMPGKTVGKIKTLLGDLPKDEAKILGNLPKGKPQYLNRNSGSKKAEKKKMPKARDMAMGNKNIVYLGDPYMVDGKMYDPVKEHPEDYIRPKDAKTYSKGSKKPVKAGLGTMVTKLVGKVFGKKSSSASPNNTDLSYQANQSPVIDLYQKATKQKTANMYTGGEVEVTKGGDYIKDLID